MSGTIVLGYFGLSEFDEIERQEAFWLTRLPLTTGVILEHVKTLESRQRKRGQDVLDLKVSVGNQLTNLTCKQCTTSQLVKVYRARWAVEIQFRAWKQSCNLSKALNRKSNEHHMTALVLAGMIKHQLGMKIAQLLGSQVGPWRLSFVKLYDLLAIHVVKARSLFNLRDFSPDIGHIVRDKRARQSPVESALNSLA